MHLIFQVVRVCSAYFPVSDHDASSNVSVIVCLYDVIEHVDTVVRTDEDARVSVIVTAEVRDRCTKCYNVGRIVDGICVHLCSESNLFIQVR